MFNLIVLILVTIVFLMFGYLITHVDIFSPFCVFCEMFLIAEFLCLFFSRMYKVEIHLNTILVIALGMISFGIVSAFFYMKRVDVRNYGEQHSRNYISINYLIQLVFLILEVLVVFYHAKYIKDVVAAFGYSTSSIFDIAGKYHVIALFNYNNFIEKAVSASFIYRHGIVWITAYAYVLLYILINNLAVKKKIEIIQIIYLGIYAFDQMLSGGRTALFRMITAILIITVICFGLNKRRNFTKLLFKIVGIIFGIILLLIGINMLLNRTGENSTLNLILESIYVYIGAPIQNLDTYLQGTRHTPELWGSQVFRNIYTYLGGKYGISQYLYQLDLPFLKHNGLNTGNVYTTFYQFYYDFGYDGIVPLMAIIALYFSCAYRKIYNNKPFTIIIYAYLFNDLIMLIFSDRFYETVASIGFVKHLLVTFILYKVLSEGNYCYTRDCVLGLFIILLYGENGEAYNVANPKSHTTIAEMAHMVADKISNGKIKVIYDIPKDNVFGYAEDTKMKLNSDKLQALGWTPEIGLEDAYKRMIEQMKIEEI